MNRWHTFTWAIEKQLEARDWYAKSQLALWKFEAVGFHGYWWQYEHFRNIGNECAAEARKLMRIDDDT